MNEQLDKVNAGASFFEAFIATHPIVTAIIIAMLCSWSLTAVFKLIVVRPLIQAKFHIAALVLFDCVVAGLIIAYMWPGTHKPVWAAFIGSSSPFTYAVATAALCWWKPGLRRFLTLRELTQEQDPAGETGDETRIPPGDTQ